MNKGKQPASIQPTDIDAKLTALRRKQAASVVQVSLPVHYLFSFHSASRDSRPRERDRMLAEPQLPPSSSHHIPVSTTNSPLPRAAPPHLLISRPTADEEFARLKISNSSTPRPHHSARPPRTPNAKLYDPNTDPIPIRRTAEPEPLSDATGSSHLPRHASSSRPRDDRPSAQGAQRQLFDHRKDDPVRFSVLAFPSSQAPSRPQPTSKSSADYISASSTSSYAPSVSSSTFTLSSTTDGSSASSALFDGRPGHQDGSSSNVLSQQLKRIYRTITDLEAKINKENATDELDDGRNSARIMLKGKEVENEDLERERWRKRIDDHKNLAEYIHNLLEISLAPTVPASLRNIPTKYNIIVRLWTFAFYKLLESLRHASSSPIALEHLQDYIYYAYTFYTGLLEEPTLSSFKSGWLEALGDLARYRMAISPLLNGGNAGQGGLTTKAVSEVAAELQPTADDGLKPPKVDAPKSVSDAPAARIDDSPSPSVGTAAAKLLEIEPDHLKWRLIARDWYGAGLAEQPGTGKLHHHLGLLSKEIESEELRGIYHFVKSMTTLHPFPTARESVLPIWSLAAQTRRALPDARAPELFVLLQGMLFTNIQLDDFVPTLARFIERLKIEGAEEREWIMMAVCNIAAVLEYGRSNGVLRKIGGVGARDVGGQQQAAVMRVMAKKAAAGVGEPTDERMDVDEAPVHPESEPEQPLQPPAFKFALQLMFEMLSFVLRHPTRKASQFSRSTLNPYLTVTLTFLATILKHAPTLEVLERSMPWEELAAFFAKVPRKIMESQGLLSSSHGGEERWAMLTSGTAPPLPEDWCLRGMEWVGRKVFERGYWKSGEDRKMELEVLDQSEGVELNDGRIEDDDERDGDVVTSGELGRRWVRVVRCAVGIHDIVDGFTWAQGTREWKVEGALNEKVEQWRDQDRLEKEEEERRRTRRWADDDMDVDEDEAALGSSEEDSEDDENDTEEVKELKARRRYLKSLLQSTSRPQEVSSRRRMRGPRKAVDERASLHIIPGYTVLVIDTNLLLSSLSMFSSLVESFRWTVVVPLPVVMELDGLSMNASPQLAEAAQAALSYISTHIRNHSMSLKVQTSKGNYLPTLSIRTEEVDFSRGNMERNMDDLILKAAIWHDEHWIDRSAMLKAEGAKDVSGAVKVVLLSLDRNLRLKARSRQLPAASERDLAAIFATGT
ncbi:hypothetical protein BDQ17DRAFT_1388235 [Cyathus striatus]|nr:hypothetical protein BDQ17DRAFT_1388235 [Cyathus striatus]